MKTLQLIQGHWDKIKVYRVHSEQLLATECLLARTFTLEEMGNLWLWMHIHAPEALERPSEQHDTISFM